MCPSPPQEARDVSEWVRDRVAPWGIGSLVGPEWILPGSVPVAGAARAARHRSRAHRLPRAGATALPRHWPARLLGRPALPHPPLGQLEVRSTQARPDPSPTLPFPVHSRGEPVPHCVVLLRIFMYLLSFYSLLPWLS